MNNSALTVQESTRFKELEAIVAKGVLTFIDVANALLEIRNDRLYRGLEFDSFEDYCRKRWKMTRNYANKLIRAAEVASNLGTMVPIPNSERQIRPLTKLESDEQREAWAIATESNSNPTAAQVEKAVRESQKKITRPITEEEKRIAEIKALEQERRLSAQNLYSILGTLTMDEPAKILDYDRDYFAGYHFELTKEVWKRAIATLRECFKQWDERK